MHLLHRWYPRRSLLFYGQRGDAVGEVYGFAGVTMLVEMDEEGGSEDVACAGRIDFEGGIGGE